MVIQFKNIKLTKQQKRIIIYFYKKKLNYFKVFSLFTCLRKIKVIFLGRLNILKTNERLKDGIK